jgi:hypothetical protein
MEHYVYVLGCGLLAGEIAHTCPARKCGASSQQDVHGGGNGMG